MSDTSKYQSPPPKKRNDEDCVCYGRGVGSPECPPAIMDITHPLRYYEFTQDEIKVLEECDRESFYHRCLPFSTLFAGLTYAAIKSDILKRNFHFGVWPKVLTAILVGHILGRVSYIPECEKKIREDLPKDSCLANTMHTYYKKRCSEKQ
ncbi:ovarian carcinoma immunoreactive antigen (OCIA) domain-containing protein [Phthorimaea operculella]|nr:ovarian carcinoma immunoreactive antigen (OCIA) domain-containing protein [Phthorimaea operculella]